MNISGSHAAVTGATGGLGQALSLAGMFADSGVALPRSAPTNTPEQVAAAVVRAIASDRAEVDVAAPIVRFGGLIGGIAPGFVAVTARRSPGRRPRAPTDDRRPRHRS